MTWTVHKFGGTSVADASCIRLVAGIIGGQRRGNLAVVVSAMKGVTDDLLGLVDKAAKRQPVEPTLKALRARHEKANEQDQGSLHGRYPPLECCRHRLSNRSGRNTLRTAADCRSSRDST